MEILSKTAPRSNSPKSVRLSALPQTDRVLQLDGKLNLSTLKQFLHPDNRALALLVRNYLPVHQCEAITETLAEADEAFQKYCFTTEMEVVKTGMLFGEACIAKGAEAIPKYFDLAPVTERLMGDLLEPHGDPIAQLRADLGAVWPSGADVATMWGRRMLPGTVRAVSARTDIPPHQDDLLSEVPRKPSFAPVVELVSNGELQVYDCAPAYPTQFEDIYYGNPSGRKDFITTDMSKVLPTTDSVTIAPHTGDLILFKGRCIHRVREVRNGRRATSCVHIAYTADDEPLRCWI